MKRRLDGEFLLPALQARRGRVLRAVLDRRQRLLLECFARFRAGVSWSCARVPWEQRLLLGSKKTPPTELAFLEKSCSGKVHSLIDYKVLSFKQGVKPGFRFLAPILDLGSGIGLGCRRLSLKLETTHSIDRGRDRCRLQPLGHKGVRVGSLFWVRSPL